MIYDKYIYFFEGGGGGFMNIVFISIFLYSYHLTKRTSYEDILLIHFNDVI